MAAPPGVRVMPALFTWYAPLLRRGATFRYIIAFAIIFLAIWGTCRATAAEPLPAAPPNPPPAPAPAPPSIFDFGDKPLTARPVPSTAPAPAGPSAVAPAPPAPGGAGAREVSIAPGVIAQR